MMKGKKLSVYAAALIITLFGAGATLLILDVSNTAIAEAEYAFVNPFDVNADFGR